MKNLGVKWTIAIASLFAVIGQFWGANYYLPLIGGVVAFIAVFFIE